MNKQSKLTLEIALKRLEEITADINDDNISIDNMILLYEEAIKLNNFCKNKLSDIENKIKNITDEKK